MLYQQGDVLIEKIEAVPENTTVTEPENGRNVLAEGEATGHFHAISSDSTVLLENDAKEMFLSVKNEATLTHNEHNAITLPIGNYKIRKVKEYDHFAEEAREVRD